MNRNIQAESRGFANHQGSSPVSSNPFLSLTSLQVRLIGVTIPLRAGELWPLTSHYRPILEGSGKPRAGCQATWFLLALPTPPTPTPVNRKPQTPRSLVTGLGSSNEEPRWEVGRRLLAVSLAAATGTTSVVGTVLVAVTVAAVAPAWQW